MGKRIIVGLTPENYVELGCPCSLNPKHAGHTKKHDWLKERFSEGFKIKLLFIGDEKKPVGLIEYVPGICCVLLTLQGTTIISPVLAS